MTDGVFPDRLSQLRARWEADPSSRIFLQLAEEYRHLGRVQDALAVLERGLKEHPGYLSALVAKGRCHIELGEAEAARVVLERVVKQDATQMVANKLLVRAYLETGDPVRARERLDLYTLLNDSDPEIEELRRRINQLEAPVQPVAPEPEPDTRSEAQPEALPEGPSLMDADPFSLEPPTPPALPARTPPAPAAAPRAAAADIFDLDAPSAPLRGGEDIFQLEPAPFPVSAGPPPVPRAALATPAMAAPPASPASDDPFDLAPPPPRLQEPMGEEEDSDLPFPELGARDSRSRYLDALASEGLFSFEPPPLPSATRPEPEPFAVFPDTATPLPAFAPVEPDFEPAPTPRIEEAAWLDEAAASSSFASSPVPVLPLEPLAPAILAPVAPVPSELQSREVREPEAQEATPAEDLWSDEPLPEPEPWAATATHEPAPFDFEPGPPPVFEEPPPVDFEPAAPAWEPEPAPFEAAPPEPAPPARIEEPLEEPIEEAASEPPATATLGDLYLRQGYHAEAERMYREVLEREPENAAAQAGLERIAALGPRPEAPEVDARRLLVGYRPDPGLGTDAELRARKAFVLNRYLERLRQGDMHDVS